MPPGGVRSAWSEEGSNQQRQQCQSLQRRDMHVAATRRRVLKKALALGRLNEVGASACYFDV